MHNGLNFTKKFYHSTKLTRELLRSSNLAIADIAARCGYGNASHFSRAFSAHTGTAPQSYRRRVRGKLFTSATGPVGTN